MNLESMEEILDLIAKMSDSSIATNLATIISAYRSKPHTHEEIIRFVHELRDVMVYTGGASSFVMEVLNSMIGDNRLDYSPPDLDSWGIDIISNASDIVDKKGKPTFTLE